MTKKKDLEEQLARALISKPSAGASVVIGEFYKENPFSDPNHDETLTGLSPVEIDKIIMEQEKLLNKGDTESIEKMLLSQAHTLAHMFNNLCIKMNNSKHIEHFEAFGRLALKAQNQARQSLSTLSDIKGLTTKTTFIKQQNNAQNQQINNSENFSNSANEKVKSDVDRRSETARAGEDIKDPTLEVQDKRGVKAFSPECLETRLKVRSNESI